MAILSTGLHCNMLWNWNSFKHHFTFSNCWWSCISRREVILNHNLLNMCSGVASIGARGAKCSPWQWKNCQKSEEGKHREKIEKRKNRGEKEEKSGRKGQNQEDSFTLPLLTNRAGYATEYVEREEFWKT